MRYEDVLAALAGTRRAHIDLKLTSPPPAYADPSGTHEVRAARRAVEVLGAENVIVTTLEDASVRAVRDWADGEGLDLLVGLSLGRSVKGLPVVRQLRTRWSELRPHLRELVVEETATHVITKLSQKLPVGQLEWMLEDVFGFFFWKPCSNYQHAKHQ